MRQKSSLREAIETLEQLELVRRRVKKLQKHLTLAQLHVRMIEKELGFDRGKN